MIARPCLAGAVPPFKRNTMSALTGKKASGMSAGEAECGAETVQKIPSARASASMGLYGSVLLALIKSDGFSRRQGCWDAAVLVVLGSAARPLTGGRTAQ